MAFSVQGPKLWNSLPAEIRNSISVNRFKSALKRYLLIYSLSILTKAKLPICTAFCRGARLKYRSSNPSLTLSFSEQGSLVQIPFDNLVRVTIRLIHHSYWDKLLKVVHEGLKLFKFLGLEFYLGGELSQISMILWTPIGIGLAFW